MKVRLVKQFALNLGFHNKLPSKFQELASEYFDQSLKSSLFKEIAKRRGTTIISQTQRFFFVVSLSCYFMFGYKTSELKSRMHNVR